MRMFWSIFFLGSLLLVGLDVSGRHQTYVAGGPDAPLSIANDPMGAPTPRP